MLIDFHTHIFPDAVAEKALDSLKAGVRNKQGLEYQSYADGTCGGLLKSMAENGVDISVAMPVVTSPRQTDSINAFAAKLNAEHGDRIISFAGVFPFQDDWKAKLEEIKAAGFRGIKLHPEFQKNFIDDERSVAILQKAVALDLLVMIHAGEDPGVITPVYCSPERLARALEQVDGGKIIAAHMGGWQCWDYVEKYLIGKDLLLDVSMSMGFLPAEQCERMIKAHGADKILFGSDSPWQKPREVLEYLQAMDLSKDDLAKITHKNALRLLGME